MNTMDETIQKLLAPGKGILAADESSKTIEKRFGSIGLTSTEENRRAYRDMLFTTPGIEQYISGVILYEETLFQDAKNGTPFVTILEEKGIVPGIKVDKGTIPLPGHEGEVITDGLSDLDERFKKYKNAGARFAKWRAVIKIDSHLPSDECIKQNAEILASYALTAQANDIVPIVEPEVLLDGTHTIETSYQVTERVQKAVMSALRLKQVDLNHVILKPSMILPGKDSGKTADAKTVAKETVRCLTSAIPSEIPGIAFLSGGQTDEEATTHLNEMVKLPHPWKLTFSYARALQNAPLSTWQGKEENVKNAQAAFLKRAKLASEAAKGTYSPEME